MIKCLVCQSNQTETILDFGSQPVSTHYTKSPDVATTEHELKLGLCNVCGVVQLAQPFLSQDLISPYSWITYREPELHLDAVVEKICQLPGLNKDAIIAGITFKDNTTLARMQTRGFSRTWTLDPREDLGATNENANIESVQALLTPAKAKEIVSRRGSVDILIARHIMEHAEVPRRFLQALSTLLAPDGYLIIEVPDCEANLARQDYTMIWEEHVLYFTPGTVQQIVGPANCTAIAVDVHPYPFENLIVLYARKSNDELERVVVEPAAVERNATLARQFAESFDRWTSCYHRLFADLTKDGRRLAAYGAGHLTCGFLNFHDVAKYFAFVVDDTPHKQGLYLPKCRLPVVAREHLVATEISVCLFGLNPQIEDKVIANNSDYVRNGGRFYSMFVDSLRSIRGLIDGR